MIRVELNEANFEYDIFSLIKAFYPREEIKVTTKTATEKEEISFRILINYGKDDITLTWVMTEKSVDYRTQTDISDRKTTKNKLKMLLYRALKEQTKKELPWGTLTGIRPTKIPLGMLEEGKTKEDILSYMKQTYDVSKEKAELSYEVAKREYDLLAAMDYEGGYSLYIGIPFCPSTCLYCSFTSYPVGAWKDKIDLYLQGVFREMDFTAKHLANRRLNTVYIGGGTPTALNEAQLESLLTKIENSFDLSDLLEFTVEAGRPDSITREKLKVIQRHGISRISINPQTMNQRTLDLIGRRHTTEQIKESYHMAREVGIETVNMDLIVGLPGETLADAEYTFSEIQKLNPDNLTVHSMAIKRSARLRAEWDTYQNYIMENSENHMALARETAKAMGMQPYYLYRQKNMAGNLENIGFSKPGREGLYNILIMEEKQTIMALGAGTSCKYVTEHGKSVTRSENVKDVGVYLERLDEMIDRKRQRLEEMKWL